MNSLDALYARPVPGREGQFNGKARSGGNSGPEQAPRFADALSAQGKASRSNAETGKQRIANNQETRGESDPEFQDEANAANVAAFQFPMEAPEFKEAGDSGGNVGQPVSEADETSALAVTSWPFMDQTGRSAPKNDAIKTDPFQLGGNGRTDALSGEEAVDAAGAPASTSQSLPAQVMLEQGSDLAVANGRQEGVANAVGVAGAFGKAVRSDLNSGSNTQTGQNGVISSGSQGNPHAGPHAGPRESAALETVLQNSADASPGGKQNSGSSSSMAGERFASFDEKGGRVERVQVVENRSFANLSSGLNSEAVTRNLLQELPPASRPASISGAAAAFFSQPSRAQTLHTLKIQLNPIQLGKVTAVMRMTGSELTVELKVESAEAFRQMTDDANAIVKSLRSQGYGIEHLTVHQITPDRGNAAQNGQPGGTSGQQFQAGNGQGQALASGGENGRRGGAEGRGKLSGDQPDEIASNAVSGAHGPDGVYL